VSFGQSNSQQNTSANNLNAAASTGLGAGTNLLTSAQGTLNAPASYYSSILSGGPAATSAMAPDVNRTRQAGDQMIQNESTLSPRGGGRGSVLFNTPQQVNSQVQSIFNTARPMAAQGATQVGGVQGQVGGQSLDTGAKASLSGFQAGSALYGQSQQLGAGIANLLGGALSNPALMSAIMF
jgi:hypothetical protein